MKYIYTLSLTSLLVGSISSYALTVSEAEIIGKTSLISTAEVSLNGNPANIITDGEGLSLYTFQADTEGVSNCSGQCLNEWPPQHVPPGTELPAPFGQIKGNDGLLQLTLKGMPLYHYDDDKKPGDAFGQYPGWDAVLVTK